MTEKIKQSGDRGPHKHESLSGCGHVTMVGVAASTFYSGSKNCTTCKCQNLTLKLLLIIIFVHEDNDLSLGKSNFGSSKAAMIHGCFPLHSSR